MVLQVAVTNVAALNLYLHQGYVLQGVIGSYYGPGKDAYFMDKVL
jgi:ribosomal protein S18 acetylase RimI-like enzyme